MTSDRFKPVLVILDEAQRIKNFSTKMACNSTYLIDRKTHISPKLKELEGILDEDEFTVNPQCRVFLSTDAGGTGLNLQAADCVVNFELPWNPARVRQRVGRVNRIGQVSRCINVVNLITKNSIEEKILAGLQLKTDLFAGVFDGGADTVEFTREKRTELLNQLRGMLAEEPLPPPRIRRAVGGNPGRHPPLLESRGAEISRRPDGRRYRRRKCGRSSAGSAGNGFGNIPAGVCRPAKNGGGVELGDGLHRRPAGDGHGPEDGTLSHGRPNAARRPAVRRSDPEVQAAGV